MLCRCMYVCIQSTNESFFVALVFKIVIYYYEQPFISLCCLHAADAFPLKHNGRGRGNIVLFR